MSRSVLPNNNQISMFSTVSLSLNLFLAIQIASYHLHQVTRVVVKVTCLKAHVFTHFFVLSLTSVFSMQMLFASMRTPIHLNYASWCLGSCWWPRCHSWNILSFHILFQWLNPNEMLVSFVTLSAFHLKIIDFRHIYIWMFNNFSQENGWRGISLQIIRKIWVSPFILII